MNVWWVGICTYASIRCTRWACTCLCAHQAHFKLNLQSANAMPEHALASFHDAKIELPVQVEVPLSRCSPQMPFINSNRLEQLQSSGVQLASCSIAKWQIWLNYSAIAKRFIFRCTLVSLATHSINCFCSWPHGFCSLPFRCHFCALIQARTSCAQTHTYVYARIHGKYYILDLK